MPSTLELLLISFTMLPFCIGTYSIDIVVNMVKKRITKLDKNFMACFVGETGGGKSSGALVFACGVDSTFADTLRVVFTPAEFLRTIIHMKKGQAIVFDEAGVGISSREWQKIQVKIVGFVAQLFRHKNLCVIFTVPSLGFVEKQTRSLSHAIVHFKYIDSDKDLAIAEWLVVRHDPVSGYTNYNPLKLDAGGGRGKMIVDPIYFPKPDEDVWKRYTKMKEAYAAKFYAESLEEAEGNQNKMDGKTLKKMNNQISAGFRCMEYILRDGTWDDVEKITSFSKQSMMAWLRKWESRDDER